MSKLQEKPSALKIEKRTSSTSKKIKFITFFFLWVIFAPLDLDCESGSGYGSRDPIEFGTNPDPGTDPDPDPQH
jgi:hypothetical protein